MNKQRFGGRLIQQTYGNTERLHPLKFAVYSQVVTFKGWRYC